MNPDELPPDVRAALEALQHGIEQALVASKTAHLTAYSQSSVPPDSTVDRELGGGSINSPDKPFIDHDSKLTTELHRRVHIAAGPRALHSIVIFGERPGPEARWTLHTKVVSVPEQEALTRARQPIDAEVERELGRLEDVAGWELIMYGRTSPTLPVKLVRTGKGGREELQASNDLAAQLGAAEDLYRKAGYDLRVAHWTLRRSGLTFREFFL